MQTGDGDANLLFCAAAASSIIQLQDALGLRLNRHCYSEQMCGVLWEREAERGSCLVDRGISEEVKGVSSCLRWAPPPPVARDHACRIFKWPSRKGHAIFQFLFPVSSLMTGKPSGSVFTH